MSSPSSSRPASSPSSGSESKADPSSLPNPKSPEKEATSGTPHIPEEGGRRRPRGTAAMDAKTRQEVARKGGLAVSRNRTHMSAIGRKGGQKVSQNREHMAEIGRKGGEASRGHRAPEAPTPLPGLTRIAPATAAPTSAPTPAHEEAPLETGIEKKTGT